MTYGSLNYELESQYRKQGDCGLELRIEYSNIHKTSLANLRVLLGILFKKRSNTILFVQIFGQGLVDILILLLIHAVDCALRTASIRTITMNKMSSMIPLARLTVPSASIIIFTRRLLICFEIFGKVVTYGRTETCAKIMIITVLDCGSAEWIKNRKSFFFCFSFSSFFDDVFHFFFRKHFQFWKDGRPEQKRRSLSSVRGQEQALHS